MTAAHDFDDDSGRFLVLPWALPARACLDQPARQFRITGRATTVVELWTGSLKRQWQLGVATHIGKKGVGMRHLRLTGASADSGNAAQASIHAPSRDFDTSLYEALRTSQRAPVWRRKKI